MASRKLDRILIVDVEATCWEGQPPAGERSEIIEIGACLLDVASGMRTHKKSIMVRPERSSVSEFCTRLTTLTPEDVEQGVSFFEACGILQQEYDSTNRVWASYGDYDRKMFESQCSEFDATYPFGKTHINVKNLYALVIKSSRELGLAGAMGRLALPLEGTHHRGGDDAWNIALVLWQILRSARSGLSGHES